MSDDKTGNDTAAADAMVPCEKRRILIVDDELGIRTLFRQILAIGLPDCRMDLAINGAEAVDFFISAHHEVIVMDLSMPVMDGETAFLEIHKYCGQEKWAMPTVVFCTGFNPSQRLQKMLAEMPAANHTVIYKPVDFHTLVKTIQDRLSPV